MASKIPEKVTRSPLDKIGTLPKYHKNYKMAKMFLKARVYFQSTELKEWRYTNAQYNDPGQLFNNATRRRRNLPKECSSK